MLSRHDPRVTMTKQLRIQRTEYTVSWPVQGTACFRSPESELVLSDVYWRWILEALSLGLATLTLGAAFRQSCEGGLWRPVSSC